MLEAFAAFAILIVLYGLYSRKLESLNITAPMAFVAAGLVLSFLIANLDQVEFEARPVLLLGEATLVIVLFSDASRITFASFRGSAQIPARLLLIGMPLTIAAGATVAALLLTDLSIWEAAILGAILSPTDAGLGQAVVSDPRVPNRIRHSLNIESGLNDGLSTPFFLIFVGIAEETEGFGSPELWLTIISEQIGYGVLVGLAVAVTGGLLLRHSLRANLITPVYQRLALPAMALSAWLLADFIDGNGFIAAFVAGMVTARILRGLEGDSAEFIEVEGRFLVLAVFFIFGINAARLLDDVGLTVVLYAVISLTLIRMVPVAISLIGIHFRPATTLFIGWFGPRGLASIVLLLVLMDEASDLSRLPVIQLAVITTVLLSVFVHGISTNPLIAAYGRLSSTLPDDEPEFEPVSEIPSRDPAPTPLRGSRPTVPTNDR